MGMYLDPDDTNSIINIPVKSFEERMVHLRTARTQLIDAAPTVQVNMVSSYLSPMPLNVGQKFKAVKQKDVVYEGPMQKYKPGNARD